MTLNETDNKEYKRLLTDDIEKSVVAFLNAQGGEIYVGVEADGTVYGVDDYDKVILASVDRVKTTYRPLLWVCSLFRQRLTRAVRHTLLLKLRAGTRNRIT